MGLTPRFYAYLAGGLLLLPLIALDGVWIWGLAAYDAALILLAAADLATLPGRDYVALERRCGKVVFLNRELEITLLVENRSSCALMVRAADLPPPLLGETEAQGNGIIRGGRSRELGYRTRAVLRGEGRFGPATVRCHRPFGLAWRQFTKDIPTPVSVLPDLRDIVRSVPGRDTLREGERATGLPGVGSEFDQMRAYVPGDDPRKVDWKATARSRHLVIRQYRADRNREVVFLLETGRAMAIPWGVENRFDAALTAILTVARRALDSGDRVRVFGIGEELTSLPVARIGRDFPRLVRRMNHFVPTDVEPHRLTLYARVAQVLPQRALVILFTDLALVPQDRLWFSTLRLLRVRHRVLLVHMADPALRGERSSVPGTPEAAASFSVAGWFLEKERRSIHVLRSEGIRVFKAKPGRMAADLLRQYTAARESGWI